MTNDISKVLLIITAVITFGCSSSRVKVEPPLDNTELKTLIESKDFVFIPRYVNPMNGRRRDLTPGYELSVSKDSLVSYLPYFGRGYIAPVSPTDVDYDFTSTKFTYTVTPARNGWNISIKVSDQPYLRDMYFRIYENASASLNVTSMDRSSISYDGYIARRKPKEQK